MSTPQGAPLRLTHAIPCAHHAGCPAVRAFLARLGSGLSAARPALDDTFEMSGDLNLTCGQCDEPCRLHWLARADAVEFTGIPGTASDGMLWRAQARALS